jgi:azurin
MRALALLLLAACVHAEPTIIRLSAVSGLRYDYKTVYVKPGVEVECVFTNADTMLHNLVFTKPGARLAVVNEAIELGNSGMDQSYIPDSPKVLWAFEVVPQGESRSLRFTTPQEEGDYPYVCTYPGHGFVMFGTMVVTANPKPPAKSPEFVIAPEATKPLSQDRAHIRRAFMPDSGPASIAVMLPGKQAYCWDAGACRFRYAWSGDGIKSDRPATKGTSPEELLGEVYYREAAFPLRIGANTDARPKTAFLGYRIDALGRPEFEYQVDGVTIREFVSVEAGKLRRRFRVSDNKPVWFRYDPAGTRSREFRGNFAIDIPLEGTQ